MRPAPSYDNNTAEKYAFYERRIRGISTAIWQTQIQPRPLRDASPTSSRPLRTFRAIATLLTTNSNQGRTATVTGAPESSSSLCITIVAPHFLDPLSYSRAQISGKPSISVESISVNGVDSRMMMRSLPEHTPAAPVDIVRHTVDVFQGLISMAQSSGSSAETLAMYRFILSRCWPEVKARLDAARYLLEFHGSMTLVRVLKGWSAGPEDDLSVHWEAVEDQHLAFELQQNRIPSRESQNETDFHFGVETASRWMKVLCKTIEALQTAVDNYAPTISQKIFHSHSLQSQLEMLRKRRSHSSTDMVPSGSILNIIEDERKAGETAGRHIFRYLYSLVSWRNAATEILPSIMMRLANSPPILHIVKVPVLRPQERLKMHSPIFIARDELHKFLSTGEIKHAYTKKELQTIDTALNNLFPKSPIERHYPPSPSNGPPCEDFFGCVHSAEISVAVINGDSSSSSPDSTSPHWISTEIPPQMSRSTRVSGHVRSPEHLVKPSSGGFATSYKRCCYCCSLLEEILSSPRHSRNTSGPDILDPTAAFKGGYGAVLPWTPPPLGYGLSLSTLAVLERELRALLLGGILKSLDHVFASTNEARAHFDAGMLSTQAQASRTSTRLTTVSEISESSHRSYGHTTHYKGPYPRQ
ncbi:hypothetical protein BDP27DRAFT_1330122 [Rhodocollybia butyracea]|uniref:Uncharacterized protein n=1 Tax=Rhodocollybia butyracea TaxID=206335 RepID=A0A9P5PR94_9AGAR|nr:hypothetical protein BDP27DRAFT_1330122 [Rhodocollybia butyracea]